MLSADLNWATPISLSLVYTSPSQYHVIFQPQLAKAQPSLFCSPSTGRHQSPQGSISSPNPGGQRGPRSCPWPTAVALCPSHACLVFSRPPRVLRTPDSVALEGSAGQSSGCPGLASADISGSGGATARSYPAMIKAGDGLSARIKADRAGGDTDAFPWVMIAAQNPVTNRSSACWSARYIHVWLLRPTNNVVIAQS